MTNNDLNTLHIKAADWTTTTTKIREWMQVFRKY